MRVLNEIAGPKGLVPTLLVFGLMLRVPIRPMELPSQKETMTERHAARKELFRAMESASVKEALSEQTPSASMS